MTVTPLQFCTLNYIGVAGDSFCYMRVRRSSKTMLLQRGIFTKIAYSKTHNNINHPLLSEGTCLHVHSVPKKDISDFNVFNTPWPDPLSSHYVKSSKFYVMQISSQEKKRKKKANINSFKTIPALPSCASQRQQGITWESVRNAESQALTQTQKQVSNLHFNKIPR